MAKRKKTEEELHVHEWFPIAIDYDSEYAFYECIGCTEHMWRNCHTTYDEDTINDLG